MKRTVQAFVTAQGHTSHYSGKKRILYITGANSAEVQILVMKKFKTLPFEVDHQAEQMVNPKPVNKYSKAGKEVANGKA